MHCLDWKYTLPNTKMDTQNDGLEKVDSFKIWPLLVSMLDFWGVMTPDACLKLDVVTVTQLCEQIEDFHDGSIPRNLTRKID